MNLLNLIRETFSLDGERVVRIRTGKEVVPKPTGYTVVCLWLPEARRRVLLKYHRIKFALKHGYLPEEVDHRDRNPGNNLHDNLRAATSSQQKLNREYRRTTLPRGVERLPGGRYRAGVWHPFDKRHVHLGVFDTPLEASKVAETWLKGRHGEWYAEPHQGGSHRSKQK